MVEEEADGPAVGGGAGACGLATARLLAGVFQRGVNHAVVLLRHSAREYSAGKHDLLNPLTPEGRDLARRLGRKIPKHLTLRGYASPPERCMETARLVLAGHRDGGGPVTRHRPLEALGVFYVLDQMKMWRGMQAAGGLVPYLEAWFDGSIPADTLMPPDVASRMLLGVLERKLDAPVDGRQLDVCVYHDITLHLMRSRLLGEPPAGSQVAYLDGLVLFREGGALKLKGVSGAEVTVSPAG